MDGDYAAKVAVITGASAGIGAALAKEVSRRGAKVVLVARRKDALERVAAGMGESLVVPADVTHREDVDRAFQAALKRFGQVDLWVNNAGRGITRPVEQLTDEDVDEMIRVNLKSALYGMQAVLPHFKERGQGALVNVSSMLARVPTFTWRSAYSAAKAALNSLTEQLRFDLQNEYPRILVSLVLPGVVATEFGSNALGGGPDSRALPGGQTADEVAKAIADGVLAGAADIYTRSEGAEPVLAHLRQLARRRAH